MFSRRIAMAASIAMLISALTTAPAAAAKPAAPPGQPRPPTTERPLTSEEEAESARKVAEAERYLASPEAHEETLVSLACVTPTAAGAEPTVTAANDETIQACYTPQGFLSVEARDQVRSYYCGPAVGQVIANYSWAVGWGSNKYLQSTIAQWMATDANGQTNAYWLEAGLERATAGSPRRPANWNWVVTLLQDSDRDGQFGDQLHTYVRSNVSGSRMPLAIAVKPHDPYGQFHLVSWPRPAGSTGHWITAYGWVGLWTGTDYARLYYTDSSRDEGGSTGKFWDPMRHIAGMIMAHHGRFVW